MVACSVAIASNRAPFAASDGRPGVVGSARDDVVVVVVVVVVVDGVVVVGARRRRHWSGHCGAPAGTSATVYAAVQEAAIEPRSPAR